MIVDKFFNLEIDKLMVNDWVYRPDCFDQITEIRKDSVLGSDNLRGLISIKELYPILLTVDILILNGFKQEEDGAFTWYDDVNIPEQVYIAVLFRKDGTVRTLDVQNHRNKYFNDKYPTNENGNLSVSEFQQVLRLCGFNNLANNFKVKNLD